jgi:hypothetical protein
VDRTFWEGPEPPRANPALILRLCATAVQLGAGITGLTGEALTRYRAVLINPAMLGRLDGIVTELIADDARLSEPTRSRVPPWIRPVRPGRPLRRPRRIPLAGM